MRKTLITAMMLMTRITILSLPFDSLTELPVFQLYFWIILFLIIIVPDLTTIAANNNNSGITIAVPTNIAIFLMAAGAGCLMITIAVGIVCYCKKRQPGKKYCNKLQCIPFKLFNSYSCSLRFLLLFIFDISPFFWSCFSIKISHQVVTQMISPCTLISLKSQLKM